MSKYKLAGLFGLFFMALLIPSGFLSWKAYEQLRWETYYQYQQEARSLVAQIDNRLQEIMDKEEAYTASDYTFLVLAGNPQAGFVQRSDLSKFPVQSGLPGIIAYFQIDEDGEFSTPLLPQQSRQSELYGISPEDKTLRKQLELSVRSILSENELVTKAADEPVSSFASEEDEKGAEREGLSVSEITASPNVVAEREADSTAQPKRAKLSSTKNEKKESLRRVSKKQALEKKKMDKRKAELGFSRLQSQKEQKKISKDQGLIDELNEAYELSDMITAVPAKQDSENFEARNKLLKRQNRSETNYSPQVSAVVSASPQIVPTPIQETSINRINNVQINLFESEIEPFQFSLLHSGHFVAYRQVWRNNKRIIQGAVLQKQPFFEALIGQAFSQSLLYPLTRLSVAHSGHILKTFEKERSYNRSLSQLPMLGELLFSSAMSAPFSELTLIFHVTDMPQNAGANFIVKVSFGLFLILVFGTYSLYVLTRKQLFLAQQQQNFVSSVSHELKTPLTSIRMYGEILKQGWVSDEKKEEYYDFIYSESERLSRLIANVLQISKVSRNALNLEIEPVKLKELMSLVQSRIDSQIIQSGYILDVHMDADIEHTTINVDTDAFIQVIINLVDNAVKFSRKSELKQVDIHFNKNAKGQVEISVRDYGPGISKEHSKKVFDLFYRAGNELTRETTGTGIGLALVKELSHAMAAKVRVVQHKVGVEFVINYSFSRS